MIGSIQAGTIRGAQIFGQFITLSNGLFYQMQFHQTGAAAALVRAFLLFVVIPFMDAPAEVTQEEGHILSFFAPSFCGTCLNFLSQEGFSRPFPSSTVKSSNFASPRRNNRSPILVGLGVRENPSSYDCAETRTHVPTSEGFEVTN